MLTPDDTHDHGVLATEARAIRLNASRLERAAVQWRTSGGMDARELRQIQYGLGSIRRSLDTLLATFGKADR